MRMLSRFLELKAREENEAQLKALGVMAASLAHEIRNPLGSIKGLTQLAQEDLPPENTAQPRLRTVISEAERLEKLITDLLDFARPKEPHIVEFDLMELLSDIRTMLQPRLEGSDVGLQYRLGPDLSRIQSDPGGLRQVLLNVLINAVDASPKGSVVYLTAVRNETLNSVIVQVDDMGQGFGEHPPEHLFRPFLTTKARGTGLGLAISRRIMESLGGSLTLENNPHGGARCSIQLPLRRDFNPEGQTR